MRNRVLYILLAFVCFAAHADLVAVKKDGSIVILQDNAFSISTNGVTIDGVSVEEIKYIENVDLRTTSFDSPLDFTNARQNPIAILDLNSRLGVKEESSDGRNLYSAEYMLQIAGFNYFITESLAEAMNNSSFILLDAHIKQSTFSEAEYQSLIDWVSAGGAIVSPALEFDKEGKAFELFGITGCTPRKKTHTLINWTEAEYPELAYIDAPEEKSTYIGKEYIYSSSYVVDTAIPLAYYDDSQDVAVLKNEIGNGCVYLIGIRWRDIIQRAQLNKLSNNRVTNNHYEGSGDVFPLFVRAAYATNNPVIVWKHTIPNGYQTVLIPTHDCDSRTALEEMHWLAEYETSIGLKAHYFITTHYFRQAGYMSAFYCDETIPNARELINQGHTIGSHSTCHLPDFGNTERFPITVTTREAYERDCVYDVDEGKTTGGSTWAEIVMSKQILQGDLGNNVRSFRSGHLCVNKNVPEALRLGDYSFSSIYTANDICSNFPFFQRLGNDWIGDLTGVLEIPLHYSDVKPTGENMNEDNWKEAPNVWEDCYEKLRGNYAPNILLIHPNKEYKMELERMFIDSLDRSKTGLCNFEDYGDFWTTRLGLNYSYTYNDDSLLIVLNTDNPKAYKGQGLVIESSAPFDKITVTDSKGIPIEANCKPLSDSKWIVIL